MAKKEKTGTETEVKPRAIISTEVVVIPTIFVGLAAYKEAEMIPTIQSIFHQAEHPDKVFVGVCMQDTQDKLDAASEWLETFEHKANVRLQQFLYTQSKGAGCARSTANQLYQKEDYYLQIDGHSRLLAKWDTTIVASHSDLETRQADIDEKKGLDYKRKIVISQHPVPYHKAEEGKEEWVEDTYVFNSEFFEFYMTGVLLGRATWHHIKNDEPYPNAVISAAFLFGRGIILEEVPINPNTYFYGEEATYGLRLFTYGYVVYHLHYNLVFHDYERPLDNKHWSDHVTENAEVGNSFWADYEKESVIYFHKLVKGLLVGKEFYGIGTVRSIMEYEFENDISFADQRIGTKYFNLPPVLLPAQSQYRVAVEWSRDAILDEHNMPMFIALIVEDKNGIALLRKDITSLDVEYHKSASITELTVNSSKENPPTNAVVWAFNNGTAWGKKQLITLDPPKILDNNTLWVSGNCKCGEKVPLQIVG